MVINSILLSWRECDIWSSPGHKYTRISVVKMSAITTCCYSVKEELCKSITCPLFCSPSSWPCAFVYNEADEKSIHGAVDNVIYHIPCYYVYICVVLSVINKRLRFTGHVCVTKSTATETRALTPGPRPWSQVWFSAAVCNPVSAVERLPHSFAPSTAQRQSPPGAPCQRSAALQAGRIHARSQDHTII